MSCDKYVTSGVTDYSCFDEATIFRYNITIFSKFKRLYSLVQDFYELRASRIDATVHDISDMFPLPSLISYMLSSLNLVSSLLPCMQKFLVRLVLLFHNLCNA